MSPPLSPRAQLKQLDRNIDDMSVLINASNGDIDHWRCGVYDWLKLYDSCPCVELRSNFQHIFRVQMDACELEICLLQTGKDGSVSWSEYILSLKKVYFSARAVCKEIDTIRTDIKVGFTLSHSFCH